ncbi:hypothetical protein EAO68_02075 [Streptomyces sp. wa22]|nr:hypothetical protein EAO68_02075 [Streptomyces sp. wa22]
MRSPAPSGRRSTPISTVGHGSSWTSSSRTNSSRPDGLRIPWADIAAVPAGPGGPALTGGRLGASPAACWLSAAPPGCAVVAFVGTVNLIYGRVLLTARGLEFRTFVGRRVIPWSEVAGIETRRRVVRSRVLCDLRVVRVRGRALTIPGTATSRVMDAELERKQVAIQERWSRAVNG